MARSVHLTKTEHRAIASALATLRQHLQTASIESMAGFIAGVAADTDGEESAPEEAPEVVYARTAMQVQVKQAQRLLSQRAFGRGANNVALGATYSLEVDAGEEDGGTLAFGDDDAAVLLHSILGMAARRASPDQGLVIYGAMQRMEP